MTEATAHPDTLLAADVVDGLRLERRVTEAVHSTMDLPIALAEAHRMGQRVGRGDVLGHRTCRICGCWQFEACEGGCWWVEDDLCSSCAAP